MLGEAHLFDVSHYNATVDFRVAKANGFRGAYLKASEGTSVVDPTFADRKKAAKAAGVPTGAYLFFHPAQPVQEQIDLFTSTVGWSPLRVALDFEVTDGLTPDVCASRARLALALLAQHYGYAPLLYTYPDFMSNCAGLQGFPLWIADYAPAAVAPRVGTWGDYAMWQTGQATVPGVSGGDGPGTDVNIAPVWARLVAPPIQPTVTEVPELTSQEWTDLGKVLNSLGDKIITHVRNGVDYNLSTMAAELAAIKADVAAIKAKG